jgi:hypothetical protein
MSYTEILIAVIRIAHSYLKLYGLSTIGEEDGNSVDDYLEEELHLEPNW